MVVVSGWVESDCETEFGKSKLVRERGVSKTGLRREWEGHACEDRASANMEACYDQGLLGVALQLKVGTFCWTEFLQLEEHMSSYGGPGWYVFMPNIALSKLNLFLSCRSWQRL